MRFSQRIQRIEVSGTYKVVAAAALLKQQGVHLLDLGAGEPHFRTPDHISEAAVRAIREGHTHYTSGPGIIELREAIAQRHAEDFETNYSAENAIVTSGGKFALFAALEVLLDHGDEVIIPKPYWVSFKDITQFAGARPVFIEPAADFAVSAEQIAAAITPRTRAIILNSPSNPSGAVLSPETVRRIVHLAVQHEILVIADECYAYLVYDAQRVSAAKFDQENVIVIGSLSKTYAMTGWRVGYALAPKPVISMMQRLQSQTLTSVAEPVQWAAVAALTGPQRCISEMLKEYRSNRDLMWSALHEIPGVQCTLPQGAFYLLPRIEGHSSEDLAASLLHDAHLVCVPGDAFGLPGHLRFSYAVAPQVAADASARLAQFLLR
ncbi:MAG TPA: pyridoxal phosphate-dependent aminotransferase [Terriglobales bacterium]